jgi:AbiU2
MNPEQDKNLFSIAKTIAEHLAFAWNYFATLRGLQQYTRECPAILKRNEHFVSTIWYTLWYTLFLKRSHCSDSRKEATGFPKLFKQLRAYLPKQHALVAQVQAQERHLKGLDVQRKVENWRNQVIAHHTITSDFTTFYKKNVVSLDEIEQMISEMNESLHVFTIPLWSQLFMVRDLEQHAREGMDQFVASMKKDAEQQHSPNP